MNKTQNDICSSCGEKLTSVFFDSFPKSIPAKICMNIGNCPNSYDGINDNMKVEHDPSQWHFLDEVIDDMEAEN